MKAAKKLGMIHVPAIMLEMNDLQRKAYSIADNKLASLANWDEKLIIKLLEELKLENYDLPSLGYSNVELEALLAPINEFNWNDFDEYLKKEMEAIYAILQLKIRFELKSKVTSSIKQYALDCGIEAKDSEILLGLVICKLLGVES